MTEPAALGSMGPVGPAGQVGIVILAAGRGERLGGVAKALLPLPGGETYLARIVATAGRAQVERGVAVVAQPYGAAVTVEAQRLGLDVVENPEIGRASCRERVS
jgi:molybdenum cofactor cytidylyltransferase